MNLPDGDLIEFLHDPMGRRIAKKVNGVLTEKYLWSGLTTLLAVYDGSDSLKMRFEYADGRMPFAVVKDGVRYYLTYDQVGSLRVVADASGNVVKRVEYDTFGNVLTDSAPLFEVPFGFAGGFYDRDVGLVRFGYRDYDPETGRWTAKDPILFAGEDVDLFGYCLGDPVNWIDVNGLTMADVNRAKKILQKHHPEYYNSYVEVSFGEVQEGSSAETTFLEGDIILSKEYEGELDEDQKDALLETMAHEYQHSNDSIVQRIIDGNEVYTTNHHRQITWNSIHLKREAYEEMRKDDEDCK